MPNVAIFEKYIETKVLLEVEFNNYGIVSIKETDITVIVLDSTEQAEVMLC